MHTTVVLLADPHQSASATTRTVRHPTLACVSSGPAKGSCAQCESAYGHNSKRRTDRTRSAHLDRQPADRLRHKRRTNRPDLRPHRTGRRKGPTRPPGLDSTVNGKIQAKREHPSLCRKGGRPRRRPAALPPLRSRTMMSRTMSTITWSMSPPPRPRPLRRPPALTMVSNGFMRYC